MKICTKCSNCKSLDSFYKHSRMKDGLSSWCKECSRAHRIKIKATISARSKIYREENKDKIKQYYQNNKAKMTETRKEWAKNNRDREQERAKKYYEALSEEEKEDRREYTREYHRKNKQKVVDKHKEWELSEKGKLSAINRWHKRMAIKKATTNDSLPMGYIYPLNAELEALRVSQDNKCYYCDCTLDYDTPRAVHLDHIMPLSKGGTHTLDNVVWSCATCNLVKHDKIIA